METGSLLLHSRILPFGFSFANNKVPFRHFDKQLPGANYRYHQTIKPIKSPLHCSLNGKPLSLSFTRTRVHFLSPVKCSYSSTAGWDSQKSLLKPLENLSLDSLKKTLSQFTPTDVVKWSGVLSIAIAATKWTVNLLFNPFFWMYFSWTWLF